MLKQEIALFDEDRIYYVYYLRRPDKFDPLDSESWQPFYVGKGCNGQIFSHRKYALKIFNKPNKNRRLVYKMIHRFWREYSDFTEEIMFDNLTEQEAFEIEIEAIAIYGRIDLGTGCLANHTNGGEGSGGRIKSDEERQKIRTSLTGKKHTIERIAKNSETVKALWQDSEYRQRQVDAHVGQTLSPEKNIKLHEGSTKYWTGRSKSPEHCAKISKTLLGNTPWNKGKKTGPQSEESKRKKSLTLTKAKRLVMLKSILEFIIIQKEANLD